MKLLTAITTKFRAARVTPAPDEICDNAVTAEYPQLQGAELQIFTEACNTLDEQMHALINRNADGVNSLATEIRRHSDMLMAIGISDKHVSRAGTLAQMAVELANAGRGLALTREVHVRSVSDRLASVAKAQTYVTLAEQLLIVASKDNRGIIDSAIVEKEAAIRTIRQSNFSGDRLTLQTE